MKRKIMLFVGALVVALCAFGFVTKTPDQKVAGCPSCPTGNCCQQDCCK